MGESIIGANNLGSMLTSLGRRVGELEQYRRRDGKPACEIVVDDDDMSIVIRVADKDSKLFGAYFGVQFTESGCLAISGDPKV